MTAESIQAAAHANANLVYGHQPCSVHLQMLQLGVALIFTSCDHGKMSDAPLLYSAAHAFAAMGMPGQGKCSYMCSLYWTGSLS